MNSASPRRYSSAGALTWAGVGPVYGTAIALTIRQLPCAHVPICQR